MSQAHLCILILLWSSRSLTLSHADLDDWCIFQDHIWPSLATGFLTCQRYAAYRKDDANLCMISHRFWVKSMWWFYHCMALVKYTLLSILINALWFTYASPSCPGWLVCLAGPRLAISGYWPFCLSVVCSLQWGENTVKLWFWVLVCDYVISLHDSSNVHTVVFCIVL